MKILLGNPKDGGFGEYAFLDQQIIKNYTK